MAAPQGIATFPGVNQIVDATYSLTHGISPSVATLTIAPQYNFTAAGGPLRFLFDGLYVTLPDCRVDKHSFRRTARGEVWQLAIFDRRWKWMAAGGRISGHFNLRKDDGTIRDGTEKTPQELATLLLEAMGESGYSVARLPNLIRPQVEWDEADPPQELARLCDSVGCRVVLQGDNTVGLWPLGTGAPLPSGYILEDSLTIDPPETPDKLTVVCGPTRYQVDLELEAVGKENDDDGTIKLVNGLAYKPAAGWAEQVPPWFDGVTGTQTRADSKIIYNRDVAAASVWKMYRVKFPLTIDGYSVSNIEDLDHLEIELELVDTKTDNGVEVNLPAEVWGTWCPGEDDFANETDTVVDRPWTWDGKHGILTFSQPLYRNSATGSISIAAATLYLKTAVRIRHKVDRSWSNYHYGKTIGNWGTKERLLHHDELHLTYKNGVRQNEADLEQTCRYYLDAAEAQYQTPLPQTRTYAGLVLTSPDGAIHQVTWSVGRQGCTTKISRNNEHTDRTIPYKERRMLEKAAENDKKLTRWEKRQQRLGRRRLTAKAITFEPLS
jgi:hypothetical protein